ncbi:NAD(P)/FAD-dependent oxidoreductase [Psychromarinibacter sp. C21-152]|uniref:NAD(P)/FAD-dependent oxidoreductase n=1 Tax=Psychromarinibacter sediminicola TaxID=3033385 RepID=A0AAE3T910_9RHOB|nr:NAD(P)/FAD-dependent oxidoreductase [Psychromarinibacter sediminicola]MDF0601358.1 NAD(P)/FAD-dependent oxidoreductase [Psychromarinibacter sediminicola]
MHHPTIILGAGAAGLMAAAHAGPGTLVIDHAKAPGEKIRISGGGRCNFTNLYAGPENFLSENPHFCKSALARYTQWDFIDLVGRHGIPWHEKVLGQLFCDTSAKDVIAMLLAEMRRAGAEMRLQAEVQEVAHGPEGFTLTTGAGVLTCDSLVIATGGKSIPKMGASGFAYRVAEQFGHRVTETRPALVPLTFGPDVLSLTKPLAGVSLPARVACGATSFEEALLFTHRGLSGPAILQISSYWRETKPISVDLLPGTDALAALKEARRANGRRAVGTALAELLPTRLAAGWAEAQGLTGQLANTPDARLAEVARGLQDWQLTPAGTEGYRTAEVTLGGVATDGLDSRTMESKRVPGLYFIGEGVDVTGWLGGYNFQWAWSSGWAAGTAIAAKRA